MCSYRDPWHEVAEGSCKWYVSNTQKPSHLDLALDPPYLDQTLVISDDKSMENVLPVSCNIYRTGPNQAPLELTVQSSVSFAYLCETEKNVFQRASQRSLLLHPTYRRQRLPT
jgi:hypothetical protein